MKKVKAVLLFLCSLAVFPVQSFAAPVIHVGGGSKAGEYINIAGSICSNLGNLFGCVPEETGGTVDNGERLVAGTMDVALMKGDVAASLAEKNLGRVTVIRYVAGEAVLVFMKPEIATAVGSWMGVKDNAFLVSIGLPGEKSGDAALFRSLQGVQGSSLKDAEVTVFKDRSELVSAVVSGKVKIGFLVQYPNPDNATFKAINDAGLVIMGVVDPDFSQMPFGEKFAVKPVTVGNAKMWGFGGSAKSIETVTVPVGVVARDPSSIQEPAQQRTLAAAIKKIAATEEGDLMPPADWMQGLINAASTKIGQGTDALVMQAKSLASGAKERLSSIGKGK